MASSSYSSSSTLEYVEDQDDNINGPQASTSGASTPPPAPPHVRLPPEGKFVSVPRSVRDFALKMECPVYQINAQRFFGPPTSVARNWTPEKGSEVFIGRLPRDILEPELVPWLEQIGPIFQLRLMMDFSGTNKGFCFVKYFTKEQADLAVEALNKMELKEQCVVVAKSVDNKRIVLNGVSTDKTEEDIRQVVETMSDGVSDIEITWQVNDGSPVHQRGVAFVTYQSHRDAAIARKKMLQKPLFMWNHRVFADWAESAADAGPYRKKGGNGENVLVVHGLAKGTRLQTMWQTFKTLGPFCGVEYIQMTRKKDKAFVFFKRRAQAEVAKVAFDGTEIQGCKVRVGWCDPESAPKRKSRSRAKKPRFLQRTRTPLASFQQPCMDPAHYWSGGDWNGYEQQQLQQQTPYQYPWYPQEMAGMTMPQQQMMMPMSSSGPMSYVSSGGGPSLDWASVGEPSYINGQGHVFYQAYQYQGPGQEGPSGTVFYVPVNVPPAAEYGGGYQQGYQDAAFWEDGASSAAPAYSSPSTSTYPPVYWTHYTPYDYYRQVVEQEEGESKVISHDDNHQVDNQEEGQVEEGNGQGLQSNDYSNLIWV